MDNVPLILPFSSNATKESHTHERKRNQKL